MPTQKKKELYQNGKNEVKECGKVCGCCVAKHLYVPEDHQVSYAEIKGVNFVMIFWNCVCKTTLAKRCK